MKKSIIIQLFLGLATAFSCQAEPQTAPADNTATSTGAYQPIAPATTNTPITTAVYVKHCLTLTGSSDTCYFDANYIAKHPAPNGAEPCRPNTCW